MPHEGRAVPIDVMWPLSQGWYGDRLDPDFTPRPLEAAQELLREAGLTDPFWRLQ